MKKAILFIVIGLVVSAVFLFSSCKSCNKKAIDVVPVADTTSAFINTPSAPHADTSIIPLLTRVLDDAFAASAKKDYAAFASYIVYRGPDSTRHGYDVFKMNNTYEKNIVKITADVFSKWSSGKTRSDVQVFEMQQPDGRSMVVLEVVFTSQKFIDRKFFGFLAIGNELKIADVTSWI